MRAPRADAVALSAEWSSQLNDYVVAAAWSPDGAWLAAAAVGGPVRIWDAATGRVHAEWVAHGFGTCALAWHPRDNRLATCGQDGHVTVWSNTGDRLGSLPAGAAWVERLAWSPDGRWLVAAAGRHIRVWTSGLEHVRDLAGHRSTVADVSWNPAGIQLAAAGYGGVWLWHPERGTPDRTLDWTGSVLVTAWSPDGRFLATGDQDATVHFWYTDSGEGLQMSGYPAKVRALSWDATGTLLATGGASEVSVWKCAGKGPAGTAPILLPGHEHTVSGVAFQRTGSRLASIAPDGRLVLWEPRERRPLVGATVFPQGLSVLAWSPDDTRLVVGGEQGLVAVIPDTRRPK